MSRGLNCGASLLANQIRSPVCRSLCWLRGLSALVSSSGKSFVRDIETEHEKFAVNTWGAPGGVLRDHPKIRSRTSWEVLLRPTIRRPLEMARQYIANPDRCQRTTVSGPTMMRACFHSDQNLRTKTQKSLSRAANLGRACFRFSTCELLAKSQVLKQ